MAVVIQDGLKRMYEQGENVFYYITMYNEDYVQPEAPANLDVNGILKGLYLYKPAAGEATVQLFGSGTILNEVVKAQQILADEYKIQANVWSVPSYTELRRDALAIERWNRLHPAEPEKKPYLLEALGNAQGPVIAASDYMKVMPDALAPWLGQRLVALGTDGFGRSDNREYLRAHFEIGAKDIVAAALSKLVRDGKVKAKTALKAFADLGINTEKKDAARA
jgi:pyruvate dehydrogenase E1 component